MVPEIRFTPSPADMAPKCGSARTVPIPNCHLTSMILINNLSFMVELARVLKRAAALWMMAFIIPNALAAQSEARMSEFLLDDFSTEVSKIGTRWEGFTDRVMGGRSDMQVGIKREDGSRYLAMSGNVSLANNGGFIQARLLLSSKPHSTFDASSYSGIKLTVKGQGNDYYIFIRTSGNLFPWSFFMARLPVSDQWQEVSIPWESFKKGDYGSFFSLNPAKLTSIAVVAYKRAFTAALDVKNISFY
jgi:Complex I intermediate-associated protein 30 (CIA30)